ncbi:MAG: DUF2806 domain-containing protein [Candidatus Sulfotelmatobacter sp.]
MTENPLANLGELTRPASVLVEKISDAVGGVFKPYQIVRVARAEAAAERIQAEGRIQVTDLQRRAMHRFLEEEAKKQSNIEAVTQKALPLLDEKSCPQNVEDDWITNFFDRSRIISDEAMQKLWSKLLASEANCLGTISKRTVNLLSDLDKRDAEQFMRLCGFAWVISNSIVPLVFDVRQEIYGRSEVYFNLLSHLETLGLIQFENFAGFKFTKLPQKVTVYYYDAPLELTLPNEFDNDLAVGTVLLTRAGHDLARICGCQAADGFFDDVYDIWANRSLVPKREQGPAS